MLNRLRELTKSFGNQAESERTEQLKRTKTEVEKNVTRILKLIKNEDQGKGKRKPLKNKEAVELIELVEDFYKEYESLCALCDNLLVESIRHKKHVLTKNESEYSFNSASDSEYHSSEEIDIVSDENAKLESEIDELKHKLVKTSEENKALKLKWEFESLRVKEMENVNKELTIEVDKKGREISALVKAKESNGKLSLARIKELEDQLRGKAAEAKQQGDKRKGWHSRVLELESVLKGKEEQNFVLVKKIEENESNFVFRIEELAAQKRNMQAEIDSLRTKKHELEGGLKDDLVRNNEVGDEETQLGSPMKGKIDTVLVKKKTEFPNVRQKEESARSPTSIMKENIGNKRNRQAMERKMEDLADKFRVSFEDKLRLLFQRILITEHLHNEVKEAYKVRKEMYEKSHKELEEKIGGYESEFKRMKEVSELAQYTLNGLDLVVSKFENENENFLNHISRVSNELKHAKRWVKGTTSEIKRLKHNVDCLVAYLEHKEEQEYLLRDNVWKLEAKVSKEGGDKLNMIQEISQLEKRLGKCERLVKEKDERLLSLGEEKREAIRQLCISVDYYRAYVDHLKLVISKMRVSYGWR